MVFQSLALFPHLNVADNITYGLRIRGEEKAARRRRAEELLELVRLPGVADRHVSQLSDGQQQRVVIARALALEPELFLLDEPLSALDAKLREEMQVEVKLLQQRLGVTTILVTHDQLEPLLGPAAKWLFAIGIFSAGMTSAVTAPLAAAYATTGPSDGNAICVAGSFGRYGRSC